MGETLVEKKQKDAAKLSVAAVERHGEKIILPDKMSIADAIKVLTRMLEQDEMSVTIHEEFDCFVFDGAWAVKLAMERKYGVLDLQSSFWHPPTFISVVIDDLKNTVQVPWGQMGLPVIPKSDGYITADVGRNSQGRLTFRLVAEIRQKWAPEFKEFCAVVREELSRNSLYKGKAISIRFKDDSNKPIQLPQPLFIRLSDISENSLVFSREVDAAIRTNLFTPIQHTLVCREQKIPLKRGILLAGDYGVGKTLVAYATAKVAVEHGWTFVYCQSINEFPDVMRFAQQYEPVVVFCEDIDKVLKGNRDISMDQILNVMDGVDSKKSEILVILTTNNVDEIHQAALRPGRLDAVIHVKRPDAEAATRLIRMYGGSLVSPEEDLSAAANVLAGRIPAVIRECVERAKLSAIRLADGFTNVLTGEAVLEAAESMSMQLALLEREVTIPMSEMEKYGHVVGSYIVEGIKEAHEDSPEVPAAVQSTVNDASRELGAQQGGSKAVLAKTPLRKAPARK